MRIANNEYLILEVMGDKELVARQIVNRSRGRISIQNVYTLLKRLKQRKLVQDRDVKKTLFGETFRRVAYRRTFLMISRI